MGVEVLTRIPRIVEQSSRWAAHVMMWGLRLDDGSLLLRSKDGARRLTPEAAEDDGRLTEKDVDRLIKLLNQAGELTRPDASQQSSRAAAQTPTHVASHANKRPRIEPAPPLAGAPHDWANKAKTCMQAVYKSLGPNKTFFYKPVDANLVPSYYTVIKRPITLRNIEMRLKDGTYTAPQAFYDDMELCWENCRTFNPPGDQFRTMGDNAALAWRQAWATSGLANTVVPAGAGGVTANPYAHGHGHSHSLAPVTPHMQHGLKQPQNGHHGDSQAASPEQDNGGGISQARRNEIGEQLMQLAAEEDEDKMAALVAILPQEVLGPDGDELDYERLHGEDLRRVDEFLRSLGYPATS